MLETLQELVYNYDWFTVMYSRDQHNIVKQLPSSIYICVFVCVLVTHLCPTLCNSTDCSSPDSSVHGILQVRILEWVAIPFSRGSSWPRDWTWVSCVSCTTGRFFTTVPPRKPKVKVKVAQSCPTLCDPMDYTVRGILQARILEWVAIPFSRGSSWPRDWTWVSYIADRFVIIWAIREALK